MLQRREDSLDHCNHSHQQKHSREFIGEGDKEGGGGGGGVDHVGVDHVSLRKKRPFHGHSKKDISLFTKNRRFSVV